MAHTISLTVSFGGTTWRAGGEGQLQLERIAPTG